MLKYDVEGIETTKEDIQSCIYNLKDALSDLEEIVYPDDYSGESRVEEYKSKIKELLGEKINCSYSHILDFKDTDEDLYTILSDLDTVIEAINNFNNTKINTDIKFDFNTDISSLLDDIETLSFKDIDMDLNMDEISGKISSFEQIGNLSFSSSILSNMVNSSESSLENFNLTNVESLINSSNLSFDFSEQNLTESAESFAEKFSALNLNISTDEFKSSIQDSFSNISSLILSKTNFIDTGAFDTTSFNSFQETSGLTDLSNFTMSNISSDNIQGSFGDLYLNNELVNLVDKNFQDKLTLDGIDQDLLLKMGYDVGLTSSLVLADNNTNLFNNSGMEVNSSNITANDLGNYLISNDINEKSSQLQIMLESGEITKAQMQEIQDNLNSVKNEALNTINEVSGIAGDGTLDVSNSMKNANSSVMSNIVGNLSQMLSEGNVSSILTGMGAGLITTCAVGGGGMMMSSGMGMSSSSAGTTETKDEKLSLVREICKLFENSCDSDILVLLNRTFYNRVIMENDKKSLEVLKKFIELKKKNVKLNIVRSGNNISKWNKEKMNIELDNNTIQHENEENLFNEIIACINNIDR